MLMRCGCKSAANGIKIGAEQQDAMYGEGIRVHTPMAKKEPPYFRCTVCGTERSKPGASEKKSEAKLAKAQR